MNNLKENFDFDNFFFSFWLDDLIIIQYFNFLSLQIYDFKFKSFSKFKIQKKNQNDNFFLR